MKTLAFDLDGKSGLDQFLSRRWIMKYLGLKVGEPNLKLYSSMNPRTAERYRGLPQIPVRVWHTTNGWHLEIDLDNEIDNIKAILMQSLLGSDYRREMCLLQRLERGCNDWNNLYREKHKVNELGQTIRVSFEKFDKQLSEQILDLLELGQ
jgi:hypothetical protein